MGNEGWRGEIETGLAGYIVDGVFPGVTSSEFSRENKGSKLEVRLPAPSETEGKGKESIEHID